MPDISLPDKRSSNDRTGDVTMGLAGDISDIQPEPPTTTHANMQNEGTPGFNKNKDFVNFYEGNSEDLSMLKDMTLNPND